MQFISKINYLVIHHSATEDSETVSWQAIKKYHQSLGWKDIGYHFGLEQIGKEMMILTGRPIYTQGAHTYQQNMNNESIGICCIGNFDKTEVPEQMLKKLTELCASLCYIADLSPEKIKGHFEYAPYKTCPGKKFPLEKLRNLVSKELTLTNIQKAVN